MQLVIYRELVSNKESGQDCRLYAEDVIKYEQFIAKLFAYILSLCKDFAHIFVISTQR